MNILKKNCTKYYCKFRLEVLFMSENNSKQNNKNNKNNNKNNQNNNERIDNNNNNNCK